MEAVGGGLDFLFRKAGGVFIFVAVLLQLAKAGLQLVAFFFAFVCDLCTSLHDEAIGSFITNLPAAFWMFASVVVACLTAIHISSK